MILRKCLTLVLLVIVGSRAQRNRYSSRYSKTRTPTTPEPTQPVTYPPIILPDVPTPTIQESLPIQNLEEASPPSVEFQLPLYYEQFFQQRQPAQMEEQVQVVQYAQPSLDLEAPFETPVQTQEPEGQPIYLQLIPYESQQPILPEPIIPQNAFLVPTQTEPTTTLTTKAAPTLKPKPRIRVRPTTTPQQAPVTLEYFVPPTTSAPEIEPPSPEPTQPPTLQAFSPRRLPQPAPRLKPQNFRTAELAYDDSNNVKPSSKPVEIPVKYNFQYGVNNEETGDIKSLEESREDDVVKGSYSVVEPSGRIRIVEYTASDRDGFVAKIRYEEPKSKTTPEKLGQIHVV